MEKWDKRFLELADHIAAWSKDPSKQVGAVIVNDARVVVGMGYNGFPRGFLDRQCDYEHRETKYKLVVHAEANAILNSNGSVKNCTLYTNFFTCNECTKLIIQSGISSVVSYTPESAGKWIESFNTAQDMYNEVKIGVKFYDR